MPSYKHDINHLIKCKLFFYYRLDFFLIYNKPKYLQ